MSESESEPEQPTPPDKSESKKPSPKKSEPKAPGSKKKTGSGKERLVGPFRLGKQLGAGGMGIVYEAIYTKNGARVALKMLTPSMSSDDKVIARFEREMSILKKLKHPNIVRYYGGGKHRNQHYYAMEVIRGGTLEDEMKKEGKLHWERVVDVAEAICNALEHLHQLGIIHRDLKPANLFLDPDHTLKLGDFGIARDTRDTALTAAGRTVGTYNYMAPEQIIGKPPVSRRTDLYALGCVMYQMLTGRPPFQSDNQADLFMMHINDAPEPLRNFGIECPVWLQNLLAKLLEKDPEERPFDARAVKEALGEVKRRATEQVSVVSSGAPGENVTMLLESEEQTELRKALRKKKKKKKKTAEPIYERGWFLGLCLAALVGVVTYLAWPLSEQALAERIATAMESDDPEVWRDTRDRYIDEYLERFPEGDYAGKARDHLDQIEMHNTREWLTRAVRKGLDPRNDVEKLFLEAAELERTGDIDDAQKKYAGIVELHRNAREPNIRAVVNAADDKVRELDITASDETIELVKQQLDRAENLYESGDGREARKIWRSIVDLYGERPEFGPQVDEARRKLDGDE